MSTFRLAFLVCDACNEEYDGHAPTVAEVRYSAGLHGWKRERWQVERFGREQPADVCPDCLKKREAAK